MSQVLKSVDEIAYNCGYNDFVESERDTYEDNIRGIEDEIKELREELQDLENEEVTK